MENKVMENKVFENTTMKHKTRVAEPLDGEPLLEVSRLSANIGQFRILEEVSFAAHKNEITVILGRNGAGKTTTLRTLMGYIGANGGSVHFQGRALTGLFTHQIQRLGIGYVPEDDNVFSNLTVEENLRLSIRERKPSHSESGSRKALESLRRVDSLLQPSEGTSDGKSSFPWGRESRHANRCSSGNRSRAPLLGYHSAGASGVAHSPSPPSRGAG